MASQNHVVEHVGEEMSIRLDNSDCEFSILTAQKSNLGQVSGNYISTIADLNRKICNFSLPFNKNESIESEMYISSLSSEKDGMSSTEKEHNSDLKVFKQVSFGMKPILVELHIFPGYSTRRSTPLPCSVDSLTILTTVISAQAYLANKGPLKKACVNFFHSQQSQDILQDVYWWFFLHKYQPEAESQGKLFERISKNYCFLLVEWLTHKHHNYIFQNYADWLSQSVYSVFCHAFPNSYRQFNSQFRDDLLSVVTQWTMGTKATPRVWKRWDFMALEPTNLRKGEQMNDDVTKRSVLENDLDRLVLLSGDFNSSLKQEEDIKEETVCVNNLSSVVKLTDNKKQSCPVEDKVSFERVVFDLYGRSPLVAFFMKDLLTTNSMYIQRTEVKSLPPSNSKTYEEVVQSTKKATKKKREAFKKRNLENNRDLYELVKERQSVNKAFSERTANILSRPQDVKQISDLLRQPDTKEDATEADLRSTRLRSLLTGVLESRLTKQK